jgi:hypothetical protein
MCGPAWAIDQEGKRMNRKHKIFRLALASVLALAISASSAAAAEFHTEAAETVFSGSQVGEDVWTFQAGTVKCTEATYTGLSTVATSTSLTVTPTYGGCTAFGFIGAKFEVNGCQYKFTATTATTGALELCPGGQTMTIITSICDVHISKSLFADVSYASEGTGSTKHTKITVKTGKVHYRQVGTNFPACETLTAGTGGFNSTITITGSSTAGAHHSVTVG